MSSPTGFARVTISAPSSRVDLALPHTATLAEVLPQLVRLVGAQTEPGGSWLLSRVGERPFDTGRSVSELDLRDGEVLQLVPRRLQPPPPVFDDVVDAIGEAARSSRARWRAADTRLTGLVTGAALLLAAAAVAGLAGGRAGAAVAGGACLVLLAAALVLSRAFGDSAAGAVLAVTAVGYAVAGGFAAVAATGGPAHAGRAQLTLAAAAGGAAAVLGLVAVGDHGPVFAGLAVTGGTATLAGAAALVFGGDGGETAAVTAAVLLAATPLIPVLALRLAGVPLPTVPGDPRELRSDGSGQLRGGADASVLARADRADRYLAALNAAVAAGVLGCAAVLAAGGSVAARWLCLVLALALPLRARAYGTRTQRLVLIAGGAAIGVLLLAAVAATGHGAGARTALPCAALAAAGVVVVAAALMVPGRRTSPYWGRLLDWMEITCLVAVVPLGIAVLGLYGYARGLGG